MSMGAYLLQNSVELIMGPWGHFWIGGGSSGALGYALTHIPHILVSYFLCTERI